MLTVVVHRPGRRGRPGVVPGPLAVLVPCVALTLAVGACSSGGSGAASPSAPGSSSVNASPTPTASDPTGSGSTTATSPVPTRTSTASASTPSSPSSSSPPVALLPRRDVPSRCDDQASPDELQAVADAGRFTWRRDPVEVVLQCLARSLGAARWRVVRIADDAVRVTEPRTELRATFTVRQTARTGPGGIWQVRSVRANRDLTMPPMCQDASVDALLRAVAQGQQPWRSDGKEVVRQCLATAYDWTDLDVRALGGGRYGVEGPGRVSASVQTALRSGHGVQVAVVTSAVLRDGDS